MTAIPATNPTAAVQPVSAATSTPSAATSSATSSSTNSLVNENTFLQLLVAQLQNQDPLNPDEQSGTQMVSELAQFSELEQVMGIGQNVQTITTDMGAQAANSSTGSGTSPNAAATNSTTSPSSNATPTAASAA